MTNENNPDILFETLTSQHKHQARSLSQILCMVKVTVSTERGAPETQRSLLLCSSFTSEMFPGKTSKHIPPPKKSFHFNSAAFFFHSKIPTGFSCWLDIRRRFLWGWWGPGTGCSEREGVDAPALGTFQVMLALSSLIQLKIFQADYRRAETFKSLFQPKTTLLF